MKRFFREDFLLGNEVGSQLYLKYAKDCKIYDYHCHLDPMEIGENKAFESIGELWLSGDHYKWRLMRNYGIPEDLITGKTTSYKQKFLAFAKALPSFIGNPVYHFAQMELNNYFEIYEPLSEKNAEEIWYQANERINSGGFTATQLIERSKVECIATTDDPAFKLMGHEKIKQLKEFNTKVVPTFRPDKAINLSDSNFIDYMDRLSRVSEQEINCFEAYLEVLLSRMDYFELYGCKISDHGITFVPEESCSFYEAKKIFEARRLGGQITNDELGKFTFYMMTFFGAEYKKRDWVMQLHLSALRNQNTVRLKLVGPDTGIDSCGDRPSIEALGRLFDEIEKKSGMPKTILYTMNPSSYYALATMAGNFAGDIKGKMQLGPAWWMMDHRDGILEQLKILASTNGIGMFTGMLTDSRSFLSYVRHDYFRRILCSLLGEWVVKGEIPEDEQLLGKIIKDICIDNARNYFNM